MNSYQASSRPTRTGATRTGATRTGATRTGATRTGATRTGATRTGAAFLLLVVMVLLVVVGATQTLVRSELTMRRSEADRMRVHSMLAAIVASEQIHGDGVDSISLPLDASRRERIEVTIDEDESHITARWIKGDQVIDQIKQEFHNKAESKE